MKDKIDYLIADLDFHLSSGKAPMEALRLAIEDYAYVWHSDGDKTILARASEVALKQFGEDCDDD